jgi:hypothetical protein
MADAVRECQDRAILQAVPLRIEFVGNQAHITALNEENGFGRTDPSAPIRYRDTNDLRISSQLPTNPICVQPRVPIAKPVAAWSDLKAGALASCRSCRGLKFAKYEWRYSPEQSHDRRHDKTVTCPPVEQRRSTPSFMSKKQPAEAADGDRGALSPTAHHQA